jgi:hypothetical protein
VPSTPSFAQRKPLLIINGNKYSYETCELYSLRRKAIRYFEKHQPGIDLYGPGWEYRFRPDRDGHVWSPVVLAEILRNSVGQRADLSGANLSEATLNNADLHEANLGGAILNGAHLRARKILTALLNDPTLTPKTKGSIASALHAESRYDKRRELAAAISHATGVYLMDLSKAEPKR